MLCRVTVLVVGVIGVLLVVVIFVVFVSGDFFASGFFSKEFAVERVAVGKVSVVGSCSDVVLLVSFSGQKMVLRSEFEMMSSFAVRVGCFFEEFVIVFRNVVMLGHSLVSVCCLG